MIKIDKEGYTIIRNAAMLFIAIELIVLLLTRVLWVVIPISVILLLLLAFIIRFFRIPTNRPHLTDPDKVFSPADGTVVVSERVYEEEFFKGECIQISVFMSIWNVHANWYPVAGKVSYFKHHHGDFMVAWHPKSSTENERTTTVVTTEDGTSILFRQIAGILAKRIVSYAKEGTTVGQNSRCGFIKFGSRLDVFVPIDADVKVEIGQKVKGSLSVLAELKR